MGFLVRDLVGREITVAVWLSVLSVGRYVWYPCSKTNSGAETEEYGACEFPQDDGHDSLWLMRHESLSGCQCFPWAGTFGSHVYMYIFCAHFVNCVLSVELAKVSFTKLALAHGRPSSK